MEICPGDFAKCFAFWDFENDKEKQSKLATEVNNGRRKMFVYVVNGKYVGGFSISLKADADGWFLSYLSITEPWRNRGIGSKIVDYSINYVKEMGEGSIFLRVLRGNAGAKRLYERKGFILFDDTIPHRITMVRAV